MSDTYEALKQLQLATREMVSPYVAINRQMEQVLRSIQQEQATMANLIKNSTPYIESIRSINQINQQMINWNKSLQIGSEWIKDLHKVNRAWIDSLQLPKIQNDMQSLQAAAKLALSEMSHFTNATVRLYSTIDFEAIRSVLKDQYSQEIGSIRRVYESLTGSYKDLLTSFHEPADVLQLPSFILPDSSRDIYIAGISMKVVLQPENVNLEEDEDFESIVVATGERSATYELLSRIDPKLYNLYRGAIEAFENNSVEKNRHVLSSLRELWNHLIRTIAPDNQVLQWLPYEGDEFIVDNKPTRKSRLLYVCREINHKPFDKFIEKDISALTELFRVFNRVHEFTPEFTERQLKILIERTKYFIGYIINVWETTL